MAKNANAGGGRDNEQGNKKRKRITENKKVIGFYLPHTPSYTYRYRVEYKMEKQERDYKF